MHIFFYLSFAIFTFFLILISKKYQFFLDRKLDNHKKILNPENNYFLGGLILISFISIVYILKGIHFNLFFFLIIFFIGILSDLKLLNDPKKRFIFQSSIIFLFVIFLDIQIYSTRIELIDFYLKNKYLNYFFVTFCLMILINGSNFIDGLNSLLILYKITILIILIIFFENYLISIQYNYELLFILLFLLVLNLFGYIILGDSGAYLISAIFGINLINFYNENFFFSPYFIILLLWYPCFELLYSIIRRLTSKKKSYNADVLHLHQLLYIKIFKKNKLNFKVNHLAISIIINLYNFISFYIGKNFIYSSKTIIIIILINMMIYLVIYKYLSNKKIKGK